METAVLSECLVSQPISETDAATEACEEHGKKTRSLPCGPLSIVEYNSSFQIGANSLADETSASLIPRLALSSEEAPKTRSGDDLARDIPEAWRRLIAQKAHSFRGSWQVLLHRSEPIEDLMKALGISMLKRRIMTSYCSVTDVEVINDDFSGPTLKIGTHLPMNNLKQCTVAFDNTWADQTDADTGIWKTRSVWIDGRAIQRRESDLGVMFDVRAVFPSDPVPDEGSEGAPVPLMLFKWTFIPAGKNEPISALRWMKKL